MSGPEAHLHHFLCAPSINQAQLNEVTHNSQVSGQFRVGRGTYGLIQIATARWLATAF